MKQISLLKYLLLFISITFFINSCEKDDLHIKETKSDNHKPNSRVFLSTGKDVSKNLINFLKNKTNSSFKIKFTNKTIELSKDNLTNQRNTVFGAVKTNRQLSVINASNTKHTFLIDVNNDFNGFINLIIVEDLQGNLEEYFLKYNYSNEGNFSRSTDMSLFTGTIETYNNSGELVGTTTINNGETTSISGMSSPPCDIDNDTDDTTDNNDTTSSGGSGSSNTGTNDGDTTGSDTNGSVSNGGEFENPDDEPFCGLSYYYVCDRNVPGSHKPRGEGTPQGPCSGAGPGYNNSSIIIKDCDGNTLASSSGRNSTDNSNLEPSSCGDVGLLLPEEEEPCENQSVDINELNIFLTDPDISSKIDELEDVANQNSGSEDGQEYQQNPDGSFTSVEPLATGPGETTFPNAVGNSILRIHAHTNDRTHSPSSDDTFLGWPSFIHQQIEASSTQFENDLTNKLTFMVISKSGIIAFRVKDLIKIEKYFQTFGTITDDATIEERGKYFEKWDNRTINLARKDCQINGGCNDDEYNEKVVEIWLERIKKNDLGTSTYRAKKDANGNYQWECLN